MARLYLVLWRESVTVCESVQALDVIVLGVSDGVGGEGGQDVGAGVTGLVVRRGDVGSRCRGRVAGARGRVGGGGGGGMVGGGLVGQRRLVVRAEAGTVVGGWPVVTVTVLGGLDILLAQVGHDEAHHCKREDCHYHHHISLRVEYYKPASPGAAEPEGSG